MNRKTLLAELESMTDVARMRRMVDEGRAAVTDSVARTTLTELADGGFYERRLSLQACYGSRDGNHALRSLSDPSRIIRQMAIRLVALICDDGEAVHAFSILTARAARRRLIRRMSKRRRLAVVDECLRKMTADQNPDANGLLSYGSPGYVKDYIAAHVEQQAAAIDWVRVSRFHPGVAADALCRIAAGKQERDWALRVMARSGAISELAEHCPDRAMELAVLWLRLLAPSEITLQRLTECAPQAMAKLVLSRTEPFRVNFAALAEQLELNDVRQLLALRCENLRLEKRWFHRRTPAERLALRNEFHHGWRDSSGCLPNWVIELLPTPHRANESRGHWRHTPLAARPQTRIPFAAALPWQEACEVLDPFVRNPDAELRAPAIRSLVLSVRFNRNSVSELLSFAAARRHEQDPVRLAMVVALSELPTGLWQPESLDALSHVVRQALDAADISFGTANAVQRLIVRLLPKFPEWSASWLAIFVKERGNFGYTDLSRCLTDDDTRCIAPVLLPVLSSWNIRERQSELLSAASSLGCRLRVFPELVKLIETIALSAASHSSSLNALFILRQHVPACFVQLIPRLIAADPSWMTQFVVYGHVHRRRQDLLTPFLGRTAYKGRFSTGNTRFVLPMMSGFQRWTLSQEQTFRITLEEVTKDAERDSPALLQAMRQLAALPNDLSPRLVELAGTANTKLITRDTALRVLGRMDAGQGIPALLGALEDDRSRIAIYALRQTLLQMPATRAISLLKGVAATKVTVAKEVIRLLGELRTEESFHELLAWNSRTLHRDVRVALLRAMWDHLDRPEAWTILEEAAQSADPVVVTMAGRTPADQFDSASQERLISVIMFVLNNDDPKVRCDGLVRCQTLPVADPQHRLLPILTSAMMSPNFDEVRAAADAVFSTYDQTHATTIADSVSKLLKNRRALTIVVNAIQSRAMPNRPAMQPVIEKVLNALNADPLTITLRVRLAATCLEEFELAVFLEAHLHELHAEALMEAVRAIAARQFADKDIEPETPASTVQLSAISRISDTSLETQFEAHPDPRLRRLAFAGLVAQSSSGRGWTVALRERLTRYQQDPAPLVAEAADFTFPELS